MVSNSSTSNVVVVIDQFTKVVATSITYDVLSKHVTVATDIRELGDESYGGDVVVFEPAVSLIVTPEIVKELKDKYGVNVFVVYTNFEVVACLKELATLIKADYSEISWNFVYAVVHNDLAILEPFQRSVKVLDSFKAVRDKIPPDMVDYLDRFRGSYLQLVQSTQDVIAHNAELEENLEVQSTIGQRAIAGIKSLKELVDRCQDRISAYEALLSANYDTVFTGFYPDRPKVLYIKQISHVPGVDTLLSVLFSVLTKQYRASCKVVKLVDSSSALSLRYVPNIYVPITDQYNTAEVLQNEFIKKLGAYRVMFDTLFLNRSGLEYLLVHDLRGTMNVAIDNSLVDLRINEVSADYALLGEYSRILSDNSAYAEFDWQFTECQKYSGSQIVKLAGHPTIVHILNELM